MPFPRLEHEDRLEALLAGLDARLQRLARLKPGDAKVPAALKELTALLKEGKALVRDFEREARTDGMPADELSARKRALVLELNRHIAAKKARSAAEDARAELLGSGAAKPPSAAAATAATAATQTNKRQQQPSPPQQPSMQALMQDGRKKMAETDAALLRAERLVEETRLTGAQAVQTLHAQTQQLNAVADGLNEIEFTMKKAGRVLRDIARGVVTDRCVALLLLLVAGGTVALVVTKVVRPNRAALTAAAKGAVDAVGAPGWAAAAGNGTAALAGRLGEAAAGAAASAGAALSGAAGAALAGAGLGAGGGGGGAGAGAGAGASAAPDPPAAATAEASIPDVVTPAPERRRRHRRHRRRRLAERLFYGG